jgi:hypothetical protein
MPFLVLPPIALNQSRRALGIYTDYGPSRSAII